MRGRASVAPSGTSGGNWRALAMPGAVAFPHGSSLTGPRSRVACSSAVAAEPLGSIRTGPRLRVSLSSANPGSAAGAHGAAPRALAAPRGSGPGGGWLVLPQPGRLVLPQAGWLVLLLADWPGPWPYPRRNVVSPLRAGSWEIVSPPAVSPGWGPSAGRIGWVSGSRISCSIDCRPLMSSIAVCGRATGSFAIVRRSSRSRLSGTSARCVRGTASDLILFVSA